MNNRLKQFLAAENISQAQFADTIKVVRASVSHVLSGRNNPGYEFIKAIMAAYPTLNMEWLILGKGKMYKEGTADATTASSERDFTPIFNEPDLFNDLNIPEENQKEEFVYRQENSPAPVEIPAQSVVKQTVQTIVNQRKVVKVTIFFDDGTYQEM